MPTKHRRHAVTETPAVKEALDELRRMTGSERVPLGDLVILGANAKLAELRAEQDDRQARLSRLAERIRKREPLPIDIEAAEEVKTKGWVREWDQSF